MASPHRHVALLPKSFLPNTTFRIGANSSHLREVIYDSPDSDSDGDEEDPRTDSTLDDPEEFENTEFGHPLQRMPRSKSADHGLNYDSDAEVNLLLSNMTRLSSNPSRSQSVSSFRTDDTL